MATSNTPPTNYGDESIQVLEGVDHVRKRPGMYVGGTDAHALHHLVYEIVDNSIDEALAGRCDHIMVSLHDDNWVSISDNGSGIPVGPNQRFKISTLELVLTKLGSSGKFDNSAYKVSGGLHGIGAAAVNALSEEMRATVYRDGHEWQQVYRAGVPISSVKKVRALKADEGTGTLISFRPDYNIMERNEFNYDWLINRFREMAFVTRRVTITLRDERLRPVPREHTFYFEGGIRAFVRYMNRNRAALHPVIYAEKNVEIAPDGKPSYEIGVEVAFQYNDGAAVNELAFANTINTPDGGTHLTGMRSSITGVINRYARKAGFLKDKDSNFSGADTLEGLTAIVSVKHPGPAFESQTKVKLINPEVQGAVSQVVTEAFNEFLELNARDARRIIEKCMTSMRAREAARKARDLVRSGPSLLESSTLPGKLADCSQHGDDAEIYIVEGDSAGGCFSGDTLVALADGRFLSFHALIEEEASGKQNFCYTIRNNGTIGIERIHNARLTKRDAEVIRVTFDSGEVVTCTPDHRFMLQDGSYKSACELTADDSLMSLLLDVQNHDNTTGQDAAHLAGGRDKTRQPWTQAFHDIRCALIGQTYVGNWIAGAHPVAHQQGCLGIAAYRAESLASRDKSLRRADRSVKQHVVTNDHPAAFHLNRRVSKVESLRETMDVYDIEVPHTHNFALASGVFVHNSAKQGRDRHFQAILPLRGKILNTERARLDKMLDNNEIKALISALGTGVGEDFDISGIRYGRIIVMTDADVDGSHIRTLLLTFFFRHMQQLISNGHLYIAQPPIFRVQHGKDVRYVYPQSGMHESQLLAQALKAYSDPDKVKVSRYKGLGEMNPEQLWETTMDPATRTLLQVTIEDAVEADEVFNMLMGSEVPPRRKFIVTHARNVRNLDI